MAIYVEMDLEASEMTRKEVAATVGGMMRAVEAWAANEELMS